jgi:hypothetical protein
MRPLIYIETTIPSYYCDDRPRRLEELNQRMGLSAPRLITPYQLYPWEEPA